MWNKELYVREQQDAYEFFTSLIDQMDEYLKVKTSGFFPCLHASLGSQSTIFCQSFFFSLEKKAENHLTILWSK